MKWRSCNRKDRCSWWGLKEWTKLPWKKAITGCTVPVKLPVGVRGSLQGRSETKTALTDLPWNLLQPSSVYAGTLQYSRKKRWDFLWFFVFFFWLLFFFTPELSMNQKPVFWRHLAPRDNLSYPFSKRQDVNSLSQDPASAAGTDGDHKELTS